MTRRCNTQSPRKKTRGPIEAASSLARRSNRFIISAQKSAAPLKHLLRALVRAFMKSFWSSLKSELQEERLGQLPKAEVRQIVFEYIEAYYNRRRLHSSLGY
jgi:transposase InsO family protein